MLKKETKNTQLEDIEKLKQVLNGTIKIKDLEDDVKIRLIELCNKRTMEIDEKIKAKDLECNVYKKILKELDANKQGDI